METHREALLIPLNFFYFVLFNFCFAYLFLFFHVIYFDHVLALLPAPPHLPIYSTLCSLYLKTPQEKQPKTENKIKTDNKSQ